MSATALPVPQSGWPALMGDRGIGAGKKVGLGGIGLKRPVTVEIIVEVANQVPATIVEADADACAFHEPMVNESANSQFGLSDPL